MSNDFTSTVETVQLAEITAVGIQGLAGPTGLTGPGVAIGGTIGQALTKLSGTNYDTTWTTITKSTVGLGNVDNESKATMFANPTLTGTVNATGNVTVTGDLTVNGTTTTINSTTLTVDDKNIELGSVASPTNTTADGGGITLKGATDKTINWVNATGAWTSSEDFNLLTGKAYKINGTSVLSATTLGSSVTASSLTSVGTIATGTWQGTAIGVAYGGTGTTTAFTTGSLVFAGASGTYSQDNANLFWDDTNNRLGIGTTSPSSILHISSGTNSSLLRLQQTGANNQATINFSTTGGTAEYSLDQSGNVVFRTQQSSLYFDNFGATGSILFRTNGSNTRMEINSSGSVSINNLTASQAVFTDASKNLISKTTTGNGNVVLSSTPTLSYVSVNNEFTVKATTNSGPTFYTAKIFSGDTDPYDGNRLVNILTDTGNSYHGGTNEINLGSKNRGTNIYLSASMLDIDSYNTVIYGQFNIGQGDRGQQITIGENTGDGSTCPPLLIEAYTKIGNYIGSSATLTVNAPATFNGTTTFSSTAILNVNCSANFNGTTTIGSTTGTETLTLGQSTQTQTVNIATGVPASTKTKTVNIGTSATTTTGTTNINIGSTTGTSTTVLNGIVRPSALTASQAVFTDANKNLVSKELPTPSNAPYTVLAYSATPTLIANTNVRITCTNNITINAPTGTPADGTMVRLWLINPTTGGLGSAINVSLNASIKIPTSSSTTSPISVAVGVKAVIAIQYDATSNTWQLATMINGYSGY